MADEVLMVEARLKDFISQNLDKIEKNIKTTDNQFKKATKSSKTFGDTFKGFVAANFAIGALKGTLTGVVRQLDEMTEKYKTQFFAETKLAQAIRSTGGAAGFTAGQLIQQAKALQQQTIIGDEAIIQGQAMLATFTQIGRETFPRAIETMLDMATAIGDGNVSASKLQQTAIQLGKALNDPVRGAAALREVGVSLTDQQMDQIKTLARQNKMYEAQKIILDELQIEFGGMAKALGETDVGKIMQMENNLNSLHEQIGKTIVPMKVAWSQFVLELSRGAAEILGFSNAMATLPERTIAIATVGELENLQESMKKIGAQSIELARADAKTVGMEAGRVTADEIAKEIETRRKLIQDTITGKSPSTKPPSTKPPGSTTGQDSMKETLAMADQVMANMPEALVEFRRKQEEERVEAISAYNSQIATEKELYQKHAEWLKETENDLAEYKKQKQRDAFDASANLLREQAALAASIGVAMADGFAQGGIKDALKNMLNVTLGYLQRTLIMAQVDAAIKGSLFANPAPLIEIAATAAAFQAAKVAVNSFQTGTQNYRGGPARLGEAGPEIVAGRGTYMLPRGANVINATETKKIMGGNTFVFNMQGGAGGSGMTTPLRDKSGRYVEDLLLNAIQDGKLNRFMAEVRR